MIKVAARAALLALAVLAAQPVAAQDEPAPREAVDWRALALSDLDAARGLIRTQTPVPYDQENPHYGAWLEQGYAVARELAEQAHDQQSYFYALARYLNGFGDPHLGVSQVNAAPAPRWPGFVVAARGEGAVVVARDENDPTAPPVGAEIVSCDGESVQALSEERLYPYLFNPRIAADQRRAVTRLFLDRYVPGAPAPAHCLVRGGGTEQQLVLHWRALPHDPSTFWTAYRDAALGPSATWGVDEVAPGVFWIGAPTFRTGPETSPQLASLVAEVNARGDALRNARAIILDLRGNTGGNSAWADALAEAVLTQTLARRIINAQGRPAVDWRASDENIAFWRTWTEATAIRDFGANSSQARFGREVIAGLTRAQAGERPIWRQGPTRVSTGGGLTQRRPRGESPFPARVYLLSNGTCASSCLTFADTVLHVPGAQLIGATTSVDGPYTEIRNQTLPSGLATITLPQKVWRGTSRAAFEAYTPDIAYDGAWDDASVRSWTLRIASGAVPSGGAGAIVALLP